jgi:hypothetical protein
MVDLEGAPRPIASYDYADIEDLGGTLDYFGYAVRDSSATTYWLGKDNPWSSEIVKSNTTPGTDTEINFYTGEFNTTRVIGGTLTVQFMVGVNETSANTTYLIPTIKLYHYDGSSSTQIGSTWTDVAIAVNSSAPNSVISILAKIAIPNTRFKRGEQFRLYLNMDDNGTGAGAELVEIGIDPQDRAGNAIDPVNNTNETTQFKVLIPYRIDD